jgi:kynurenine formamidase
VIRRNEMVKIIDLSVPVSTKGNRNDQPEIEYRTHKETAEMAAETYGVEAADFRNGQYAAIETITLTTHATSHMDAPYHYAPTSEGKPAKTIDQIPLEWCFGDGVVLDFHHKKKGEGISSEEVQQSLDKIGYKLKPFDIVLIRTDIYKHYMERGYEYMHPGMTKEATRWILNHGIKVVGIDAWGWDIPHDVMIEEMKAGKKEKFWEAHYLGSELEYCHMERLANLDKIPKPFGFKVAAFPINIEAASGAWVRAVAILEE